MPIVADKYRVREYLKEILGDKETRKILIPLLYVTDDPKTIPFDELPDEYIIKTNHASGWNIIVEKGTYINRKKIIIQCGKWIREPYGFFKYEWAYQKIPRKIIIEKLLRDDYQNIPRDFKFYIFHGECKLVHVDSNRFSNHSRSLFDSSWNFLPVTLKFPQGPKVKKPFNYKQMVQLSEKLGRNFDFVRVDLYMINNKIYFGEFTHYPGSGMEKFNPQSFDFKLGENWKLILNYWKNEKNTYCK